MMLIKVAENIILSNQSEAYCRKLNEAGVELTTIRYYGMIHDFGMLNALAIMQLKRLFFQ
jgi:acetyl esterase